MRQRARGSRISIADAGNPYAQGATSAAASSASSRSREARAHIDALDRKYNDGEDDYPGRPGEQRVIFLIEPERVTDRR